MPTGRLFRKHDSSKPLHARWGDVDISVPTEGSWNQLDDPHKLSHRRRAYGPGYVADFPPKTSKVNDEEDRIPLTETSLPSRQNSFSIRALNPRRVSALLSSRAKDLPDNRNENGLHRSHTQRRTEFAYKPIRQNYVAEVAENTVSQNDHSARFRYVPAEPPYCEGLDRRASVRVDYDKVELPARRMEQRSRERQPSYSSQRGFDDNYEGSLHSARWSYSSSSDGSARTIPSAERRSGSSAMEKRFSARPLTMFMVPDAEDLYG